MRYIEYGQLPDPIRILYDTSIQNNLLNVVCLEVTSNEIKSLTREYSLEPSIVEDVEEGIKFATSLGFRIPNIGSGLDPKQEKKFFSYVKPGGSMIVFTHVDANESKQIMKELNTLSDLRFNREYQMMQEQQEKRNESDKYIGNILKPWWNMSKKKKLSREDRLKRIIEIYEISRNKMRVEFMKNKKFGIEKRKIYSRKGKQYINWNGKKRYVESSQIAWAWLTLISSKTPQACPTKVGWAYLIIICH